MEQQLAIIEVKRGFSRPDRSGRLTVALSRKVVVNSTGNRSRRPFEEGVVTISRVYQ
jgi:hypothetical protein